MQSINKPFANQGPLREWSGHSRDIKNHFNFEIKPCHTFSNGQMDGEVVMIAIALSDFSVKGNNSSSTLRSWKKDNKIWGPEPKKLDLEAINGKMALSIAVTVLSQSSSYFQKGSEFQISILFFCCEKLLVQFLKSQGGRGQGVLGSILYVLLPKD